MHRTSKSGNTLYWVDIQLARRKGLKFYQTRCNAIIFYDTLPAYCISKVVVMKSEEIIYQKVFVSPRPPPKISYKDNWMNDLDSDVAGSSKDTQQIQPKPKTQLSRTERRVGGLKSTQSCVSMPEKLKKKIKQERQIVGGHFLSNVNSVEGINHCAFAQRGVLPHGDIPSSHTSRDPPATTFFKFSFYFRTPMLTRCEQVSDVLEMITSWVCRKRLQPSSLSERV